MSDEKEVTNKKQVMKFRLNDPLAWLVYILVGVVLLVGGAYGYSYASTPGHIRHPTFDHYHFRTQLIVDGQAVDFSEDKFQEDTSNATTSCSIALNGTPIDFHDNEDQMTHIHWGGITGGEFLKYFGWNFIGGNDNSLGRRYDLGMMKIHSVGIKGDILPDIPEDANFYVYIGDKVSYEQKDWNDFLNLDLEDFLGKKSYLNTNEETSFSSLDWFSRKAYAHGMEVDGHDESELENDGERLERINNLIGNVVIFVQDTEPTEQQIKERFANLVPLSSSVCGG